MKVAGVITEYNPFHNGHMYHLNQAKENIMILSEENKNLLEKIKQNEEKLNNYELILNQLKNKFTTIEAESEKLKELTPVNISILRQKESVRLRPSHVPEKKSLWY